MTADAVSEFLVKLAEPPWLRCGHIELTDATVAFRDLRQPGAVLCSDCASHGPGSAVCGVCGEPDEHPYIADFGVWRIGAVAVQATGLLCQMCASLLPSGISTLQLGEAGRVRVNRPE